MTTVWYRQKGRGRDRPKQWDRKESVETDSHIRGQLILDRGAHGERKVFSVNGVGTAGYPYGKTVNLDPYLTPYTEIHLRCFTGLRVRAKR